MATKGINQLGNARGQILRNIGKPKEANDALPWALPSYTTTTRDAIIPKAGMIILNTTTAKLNFYDGSTWRVITST